MNQNNMNELESLKKHFEEILPYSKIGIKPVIFAKNGNDYQVLFDFFLNLPDGSMYTGTADITIPDNGKDNKDSGIPDSLDSDDDLCWF